jgi:hypothetical protein
MAMIIMMITILMSRSIDLECFAKDQKRLAAFWRSWRSEHCRDFPGKSDRQ